MTVQTPNAATIAVYPDRRFSVETLLALKAYADEINRLAGEATALAERLAIAEAAITALDERLTAAEAAIVTAQAAADAAQATADANAADIADHESRITALEP